MIRSPRLDLALTLACAVVIACSKPSAPPPPPPPPPLKPIVAAHSPELELGTGRTGFTAIKDGDSVQEVAGAQGCCHLWISLRASGVDPALAGIRVGYYRISDGTELRNNEYRISLSPQGDKFQVLGLVGFLPEVPDDDLEVRIELTDAKNKVLTDFRRVHLIKVPH